MMQVDDPVPFPAQAGRGTTRRASPALRRATLLLMCCTGAALLAAAPGHAAPGPHPGPGANGIGGCRPLRALLQAVPSSEVDHVLSTMRIVRRGPRYLACPPGQGGRPRFTDWKPLPRAKQDLVREIVSREHLQPEPGAGQLLPGDRVPRGVPLLGLPRDMVTEVPKVTSYRYVVALNGIAIVEPSTRTVLQLLTPR
jgi:hypothetical protein